MCKTIHLEWLFLNVVRSWYSACESLWVEIPYYMVLQFTAILQIVVNKQWYYIMIRS